MRSGIWNVRYSVCDFMRSSCPQALFFQKNNFQFHDNGRAECCSSPHTPGRLSGIPLSFNTQSVMRPSFLMERNHDQELCVQ